MPKKFQIMIQLSPNLGAVARPSPRGSPALGPRSSPTMTARSSPLRRASPPPDSSSEEESSSSSGSDGDSVTDSNSLESFELDSSGEAEESLKTILGDLKQQMEHIQASAGVLNSQVKNVFRRAKEEEVRWMDEPMVPKPAYAAWMAAAGLPAEPTLRQFVEAVFDAAASLDMASRMATFGKEDAAALWDGAERVSVFDILAALPRFFV